MNRYGQSVDPSIFGNSFAVYDRNNPKVVLIPKPFQNRSVKSENTDEQNRTKLRQRLAQGRFWVGAYNRFV